MSNRSPTTTNDQVEIERKVSHLFASSDKFRMLSDT